MNFTINQACVHRCLMGAAVVMFWGTPAHSSTLQDARRLFQKGNVQEAAEIFASLKSSREAEAVLGLAQCWTFEGRDAEAEIELKGAIAKHPKNTDLRAALGEIYFRTGRWPETEAAVAAALEIRNDHLEARWLRARLWRDQGHYEKANSEFEWFIHRYNDQQFTDAPSVLLVAKAAAEYARWNKLPDEFDFILNELIPDALKSDPSYWPAHAFAGALLIEKYNETEGVPELKKALAINPRGLDALVTLGNAAAQGFDLREGNAFADQALAVNPRSIEALNLKADLVLADVRVKAALEPLERALKVNPFAEETLGRWAACQHLRGEPAKAKEAEARILARNPRPGLFYTAAADALEQRRQFDVAEGYYIKAITAAPHLAAPRNGLGTLLMRVGREDEARKVFAEARQLDPFHVRVANMTKVLKHLEKYSKIKSPHYEVWFDPTNDALLGRYASDFLERTHGALCKRFDYEPPKPSKIEVMIDHKWFSARVVGLPSIGTVGACTGNVVALTSPRSLKAPFNWARVLTHEVTHIITLQQTRFNIPHWYTEALAVMSEGYPRPQIWNELLAQRVPKNDLFHLDNINNAFARPKTPLDWQMAYCQSFLYAHYMIRLQGEKSLASMLNAYRDGMETDVAISRVFGIGKDEFEKGYRAYLGEIVKELRAAPATPSRSPEALEKALDENPKDAKAAGELSLHWHRRKNIDRARSYAETALANDPKEPHALFVLASLEWSIGKTAAALDLLKPLADDPDARDEALDLLAAVYLKQKDFPNAAAIYERARAKSPLSQKWLEGLARVYLMSDQTAKLEPVLTSLAQFDADDVAVRKKLWDLAREAKRWRDVSHWAREVIYIDINDTASHRAWGEGAVELKSWDEAALQCRTLKQLNAPDAALAERVRAGLVAAGRSKEADEFTKEMSRSSKNIGKTEPAGTGGGQ